MNDKPAPDAAWTLQTHCPNKNRCGWFHLSFFDQYVETFKSHRAATEYVRTHPYGPEKKREHE